jgi:hypothetical protein
MECNQIRFLNLADTLNVTAATSIAQILPHNLRRGAGVSHMDAI